MSASLLNLRVEGPDAARVADELAAFIEAEFGTRPTPVAPPGPAGPGAEPVRGDPWAVAAVLLAVPPTVLATWDLAQRLKLKARVERLLAWVKDKCRGVEARSITLTSPKPRAVRLDHVEVSVVIELAQEVLPSGTGQEGGNP
jgi:hypothetical protein